MKSLATMTAVAALIAGLSVAHAQNPASTSNTNPSPSNLNASSTDTKQTGAQNQSGSQTPGAAMQKGPTTVQSGATPSSVSPADPNAKMGDSGDKTTSGAQPKSTQMQSGGAKPVMPSTTGSGTPSPADMKATPPSTVK